MSPDLPTVYFTDAPPLREGGIGGHLLAYNLLRDFGEVFRVVITRLGWGWVRRADVYHAPGTQTLLFPDAPWFRPRRLRPAMDLLLFILWLPVLARAVKRAGCQRIFALIGADSWFLPKIELLRRATGLPLEIYLIDDLEESCRMNGARVRARLTRWSEGYMLRRAERIYAISSGYVEHLEAKYRVRAVCLPLVAEPVGEYTPFQASQPDVRPIVFLGSVNPLYLDGLRLLYAEISRWNRTPGRPYELRLRLVTRSEPRHLLDRLPDHDFLEMALDLDHQAMHASLRSAWALFLPYSFDPALRVMVSTSFSHKFTESVAAGRPLLVFGPAYASLSRYFREQGLPLCAHSPAEMATILGEIEHHDHPALVDRYRALVERHHSPAALRKVVGLRETPEPRPPAPGAARP